MKKSCVTIPENYDPKLNTIQTELAIKLVKDTFERKLAKALNLTRVSAPLFVKPKSGLNDNLSGVERPVDFDILDTGETVEIVHSLAKWKRMALKRYGFDHGTGLYTDMNAIRRDETMDNIHSLYVDQWDWEKIISEEERTLDYLYNIAQQILTALNQTHSVLHSAFPELKAPLPDKIFCLTSNELLEKYPNLSSKEREDAICKEYGAVFVSQIGGALSNGEPHDMRAPDYDDWQLNGDILIWNPVLKCAFEISSMGIRVDKKSLENQLELTNSQDRRELEFHKALLNDQLPLTIGGGIGQSRLCMLMLEKAHIGEVHASVWSDEIIETCEKNNICLL